MSDLSFHPTVLRLRQLKKSFVDLPPSLALRLNRKKREQLVTEFRQLTSVEACIDFTKRHMEIGSCQIPNEISPAIDLIAETKPKVMCEIGTLDCGTSLLFSRFLPTLDMLICMDLYVKNKPMLRLLSKSSLHLEFVEASSYSKSAVDATERLLNGKLIDVLLIDGDHRYEGVSQDFECYRPLVRDGGLILFHDIVQEKGDGHAWAGGVPQFWKEVRQKFPYREIINDPNQSGFGIGMITNSSI